MSKTAEAIIRDVIDLPADERERVVGTLVEMFGVPGEHEAHDEEWAAEVGRRIEAMRSGEDPGIPWEEARAEVLEQLKRRRTA